MAIKLHKIIDLVDADLTSRKFDLRSRLSDGSLMYSEQIQGHNPIVSELNSVEIRYQKISHRYPEKSKWLYWTWPAHNLSCGYSGVASDFDKYYLQEL